MEELTTAAAARLEETATEKHQWLVNAEALEGIAPRLAAHHELLAWNQRAADSLRMLAWDLRAAVAVGGARSA
jgi:hypothetical protein